MNIKRIAIVSTLLAAVAACCGVYALLRQGCSIPATTQVHAPANSVYYWRTVYDPSPTELDFLKTHNVKRVYMRMFDVVDNNSQAVPDATITFAQPVPDGVEIVPAVFVTVEAMKRAATQQDIDSLATGIVERVRRICLRNKVTNWPEVQLDCDWTATTRDGFYALCRAVKQRLPEGKLLSSTIRLHQLTQEAPPVDYGVLMVYNTDDFSNPRVTNSILNEQTVEAFVKRRLDYDLPLDIALPIYQWNLVFSKSGQFRRIEKYAESYADDEEYRFESVPYATLQRTQEILAKYLDMTPGNHSTILYHLDPNNINNYSHEQIEDIYNH